MKWFHPHQFQNNMIFNLPKPKVLIPINVYQDMYCIVNLANEEVGWLGSVEAKNYQYTIKEIFIIEQDANGAYCRITTEGSGKFGLEMFNTRPDADQIMSSLSFWGHSHHDMNSTSPSRQDEEQFKELSKDSGDFFIRGILNKHGRIEFHLHLFEKGIIFEDIPWEITFPIEQERINKWQQEISSKVKHQYHHHHHHKHEQNPPSKKVNPPGRIPGYHSHPSMNEKLEITKPKKLYETYYPSDSLITPTTYNHTSPYYPLSTPDNKEDQINAKSDDPTWM